MRRAITTLKPPTHAATLARCKLELESMQCRCAGGRRWSPAGHRSCLAGCTKFCVPAPPSTRSPCGPAVAHGPRNATPRPAQWPQRQAGSPRVLVACAAFGPLARIKMKFCFNFFRFKFKFEIEKFISSYSELQKS
jgi:hypothetical protein